MADGGSQIDTEWRRGFRQRLAATVERAIVLGDLIDEVAPTIPLHHATRFCATQRPGAQMTIEAMREACLRGELRRYPLRWSAVRGHGVTIPRSATLTPYTRDCPACGKAFFGVKLSVHCSIVCATSRGKRLAKQAARSAPQPEKVARLIVRIDRAIDELERIKDDLLAIGHPRIVHSELAAD